MHNYEVGEGSAKCGIGLGGRVYLDLSFSYVWCGRIAMLLVVVCGVCRVHPVFFSVLAFDF